MTEKQKYRVHDWVKYNYSEIGEYIGDGYTDRPLRNDEVVNLLNALHKENQQFKQAFEQTLEDAFDRNMDSRIAEEVIDYINTSFYEFLKREELE